MAWLLELGISKGKLIGGAVALVLVGLAAFAIVHTLNKVAAQADQISTLKTDLATEKVARERDVSGLTVLSKGMLAASAGNAIDERVLSNAIDTKNPKPVSPGLAAFLGELRRQSSGELDTARRPGSTPRGGPDAGE